ncbi:MAG: bifunctional methylenetetrahydrofolate dehydrogenase/methenyltetrahydrofolate cyclohydrolase FolD [Deltaproteobacteria bacterium]|nr:bifunctional methylenetetrahydrofolate dehydrogenase/methenyltetrahydrofolate cyclohydrolase FolD [Deltaproteobacteria bacterium]
MALLDGKKLAKSIRRQVKEQVAGFIDKHGRPPTLDVVLVGEDPASQIYVRNKARACLKAGLGHHEHRLPVDTPARELLALVRSLSADDKVDGVLVQLPLPDHISPDVVTSAISPQKDVDGFHPTNLGNLFAGKPGLRPCTPVGCMKLLDEAGVVLEGKNAVVVGRSNIVGKPMAMMLLERHASVTICHSRTQKLAHVVAEADVVVAAVGHPAVIDGEWIKRGAVVIDVGMNRLEDGSLVGDVGFDAATSRASWITPVPGGVGPMTVACLISNTLQAAKRRLD